MVSQSPKIIHCFARELLICISLIILINPIIYSQYLGFRFNNNVKHIDIPFENYNNLIVIPVVLNHKLPLKFILDTGVPNSIIIDRLISDYLNLTYDRKISIAGAGSSKEVNAFIVKDVSLSMPGLTGSNLSFVVLEEDYLQLNNYFGINVQGIIGYELFNRFIIKINYDKNILTLYEPNDFKPGKRYSSVPISIEDSKPYMNVNVSINDSLTMSTNLMIDLGASHSCMLEIAEGNNVFLPENHITSSLGRGLGGELKGYIARIKQLQISSFCFNNLISSFIELTDNQNYLSEVERHGTLGGEILSRFVVIFDYFDKKLYLMKNSHYSDEFEYNMSGIELMLKSHEPKQYVILDVRQNSPAEIAGLLENDEILYINGRDVSELSLNQIQQLFRTRENRKIKIKIMRENKVLKKEFRLKKLI